MTYLPKSNGSEDDNADQAEELEVRVPEMFAYAAKGAVCCLSTYLVEK